MLGTRPTGEYAGPGRIPPAEAALYLRRKQAETRPLRPRTLTFGEVDMRHTDTYVHFEGVRFVQQGNWCDPDPETGRPATDGNSPSARRAHAPMQRSPYRRAQAPYMG